MNKNSEIISSMTGIIYPVIIVFGIYIILNGYKSPGGGFQGGAVLASVFISRYLVDSNQKIKITTLQKFEKLFFLAFIFLVIIFMLHFNQKTTEYINVAYLILSNILIGFKVCCGLIIIFFRFAFWEEVE